MRNYKMVRLTRTLDAPLMRDMKLGESGKSEYSKLGKTVSS